MKKNIYTLVFLFSFSVTYSQTVYTLKDTTLAHQLLKESTQLIEKEQFDAAFGKTEVACLIFEQLANKGAKEMTKLVAQSYFNMGDIYFNTNYFDKALACYQKIILIQSQILDADDLDLANAYSSVASVYVWKLESNKALDAYAKVLKILGEEHAEVANIYYKMSMVYRNNYAFDEALEYAKKALVLHLKQEKKNNIATDYEAMSLIYSKKKEYDKAIPAILNALKVVEPQNTVKYTQFLCRLGDYYNHKGEFDKAILTAQKVLDMENAAHETDNIHWAYSIFGAVYKNKKEYDKAIDSLVKATIFLANKHGQTHPFLSESYEDLGDCYKKKGDYGKMIDNYQKALAINERLYDLPTFYIAYDCIELSDAHFYLKNYDKAIVYNQKAVDIFIKIWGKEHPYLGICYQLFAKIYEKKKDVDLAAAYHQKALVANRFDPLMGFHKVISMNQLIDNLASKAAFEQAWFAESGDTVHLNLSIGSYQQALLALAYQNQAFHTEGAKTELKKKHYTLYEGAIKTCLLSKTNLHKTFTNSEQSKAGLLQAQLKETDALQYADIPSDLLQKERDLRINRAHYDKSRETRINAGKSETDSLNLVLATKSDSLRQQYEELKQYFEKNYPDYFHLKYNLKTVDIAEVQQKLLSDEQTLLSYFVGDSSIFAFVIRKDTFVVFDFKKDFPLELWIQQLRDGLYGYHTAAVKTEKGYEMKADSFAQAAFQLHQKLLTPLSNLLSKEVIIVPDGILGYVPFDVLLAEKPKEATQFHKHTYFGKNHIISYNYSATLWQEMRNKKHKTEPQKNFIGFAPYFNGDTTLLSHLFTDDLTMRKGLDSLKYSGEEVFKAQKLMQGESILAQKATKETFEKIVGAYRIVHLATHGKANDKVGDYCFLVFNAAKDSLQNELLYVRDIYNLTLNADMVVLSACETGIGELKRGEGIVSLARAFTYSGAKSLVTTLWHVNDKSTMQVMEGFYRQLRKGKTKDYALWKAKLDYLEKAKNEQAHPFFWSAFIPIGDMRAIKN